LKAEPFPSKAINGASGRILVIAENQVRECGGSELFIRLTEFSSRPAFMEVLKSTHRTAGTNFLVRIWRNRIVRYIKNRSRMVAAAYVPLIYGLLARRLERELYQKYRDSQVEGVWCPSNELIPMVAQSVANQLRCPLHVSVFDLPFTFSLQQPELRAIREGFPKWVADAHSFDFASPGMSEYFRPFHAGRSERDIAIWSSAGVVPDTQRLHITRPRLSSIAFCGSLRFFREMRALNDGLALLERHHGRRIVLKVFSGKRLAMSNIEYMGFLTDRARLSEALGDCDVAYSPLSIDIKDRELVETSFPGKMATYLQSNIPIIAHAPTSASNYRFVTEHEVGIGIDSLDPQVICDRIMEYEAAHELRERHSHNCYDLLRVQFDPRMRKEYFAHLFEDCLEYAAMKGAQ
jgi:hypothetical protein